MKNVGEKEEEKELVRGRKSGERWGKRKNHSVRIFE